MVVVIVIIFKLYSNVTCDTYRKKTDKKTFTFGPAALRVSLFLLNSFTMLSAGAVCVALHLMEQSPGLWVSQLGVFMEGLIVTIALMAQLASMTYKIIVDRDWMVVVAGGDKIALAS